ncbi:MAG TPA: hypothetical protein VFM88_13495 [Vicinamibacteria bacterium]|nr:hypothetical protein [Vicinamibacteria bacterium]
MKARGGRTPARRLAAYYRSTDVRERLAEYCGGSCGIAAYGGAQRIQQPEGAPVPVTRSIDSILDDGADVCRSMADRRGALIHLDLDYANPGDPGEAFRRPSRVFALMEPVLREARARLASYGLRPLCLMTARGYHLVIRAREGSPFHAALVDIGRIGEQLSQRYERFETSCPGAVVMGRAHEGAGRIAEHFAHELVRALRGRTDVPVTLADVRPRGGGAFVCVDVSAYADPLFSRHIRCAFSSNQKAWMTGFARTRPCAIVLPRRAGCHATLLEIREDLDAAARLASVEGVAIPDAPASAVGWVEDYRRSRLGRFHREFERGPQMRRADWPFSYGALELRGFPECIRRPLTAPNPLLLAPIYLRAVSLALWGLGWHPRSVAGLVRSRFEADHGWGDYWRRYDPASRAEFYVRLLCGAAFDGLDEPEEFTCASEAARGTCSWKGCGHELERLFPVREGRSS